MESQHHQNEIFVFGGKEAFKTGCALDTKCKGRPKINYLGVQNIEASILRSLNKSLMFCRLGCFIYSVLHNMMKKYLNMKPYKSTVIGELSGADHENR